MARIREAFAEENAAERSYADAYLARLLATIDALDGRLRRTVVATVALAAVFFLFAHSKSTEITIEPLKLTDVKGVVTFVPAVVAYLNYEWMTTQNALNLYRTLASALAKELYPKFSENDLGATLTDVPLQVWGTTRAVRRLLAPAGPSARLLFLLDVAIALAAFFGAVGFVAYAYITLAGDPKTNKVAVTASGVFAAVNLLRAALELRTPTP